MRAVFLSPSAFGTAFGTRRAGRAGLSLGMALGALSTGCTGTISGGQPGVDAETTVTHAVVIVERTADTTEGTRAAVSARFARVAAGASAGDTLRAIGANFELPARGMCASIRAGDGAGTTGADAVPFVELLDVGRISVDVAGSVTSLVPRQLPYVTDVVTGTVYAKAAEQTLLPASTLYGVHATGTADVPAFDVSAVAPGDPSDVVIMQETSPGNVVAQGSTIDFSWPREVTVPADVLYVEIQPALSAVAVSGVGAVGAVGAPQPAIRCVLGDAPGARSGDEGLLHGAIPTSLLGDAGSLVVHRVHTEPLQLRGVDDGELRFDFARVVGYVRQ
jgi:hypothetical protein